MEGKPAKINPRKYLNLKVESLCAELLQNGFSFENIVLIRGGSFKKRFSKDIDRVTGRQEDDESQSIEITVNRDSIYDLLPEGLFHQPVARNKNASVTDMVSDFRRLKEEEKKARQFFQPLEQEFTRFTTLVEQEERKSALSILGGNIIESFAELWNIPGYLPLREAKILTSIMPWAYLLKGDRELTAKGLQLILNKNITSSIKIVSNQSKEDGALTLENTTLGADTVTGNNFLENSVCWIFTINDILANEMAMFISSGPFGKLLQLFAEIFVPIEFDVIFEYEIKKTVVEAPEKILGYGFTI